MQENTAKLQLHDLGGVKTHKYIMSGFWYDISSLFIGESETRNLDASTLSCVKKSS